MSNFGRNDENKKRLKLKSFFRRFIQTFLVVKIENLNQENAKLNGISGSGSSGTGDKVLCKTYTLESLTDYFYFYSYRNGKQGKRHQRTFNKQQLIGKVIIEGKKQFRIIN